MLKYTVLSQILNVLLVYGNINIRYPSTSDYQQVDNMTQYITNERQHNITAAQLLYCPLEPMCHNLTRMHTYAKNVEPYFMNCCEGCSCSVASNIHGEQCPNTDLEPSSSLKACIRPQYLMYGQTSNNVIHSYYMVVSCSPDFLNHDDVISKCTSEQRDADDWLDLSLFLPVSSVHTNTTYKNRYCAMCNHEKQENITDWKLQVACSTVIPFIKPPINLIELLTMIRQYKTCNIYFYDMAIENSRCDWGQYTTCIRLVHGNIMIKSLTTDVTAIRLCMLDNIGMCFVSCVIKTNHHIWGVYQAILEKTSLQRLVHLQDMITKKCHKELIIH